MVDRGLFRCVCKFRVRKLISRRTQMLSFNEKEVSAFIFCSPHGGITSELLKQTLESMDSFQYFSSRYWWPLPSKFLPWISQLPLLAWRNWRLSCAIRKEKYDGAAPSAKKDILERYERPSVSVWIKHVIRTVWLISTARFEHNA